MTTDPDPDAWLSRIALETFHRVNSECDERGESATDDIASAAATVASGILSLALGLMPEGARAVNCALVASRALAPHTSTPEAPPEPSDN